MGYGVVLCGTQVQNCTTSHHYGPWLEDYFFVAPVCVSIPQQKLVTTPYRIYFVSCNSKDLALSRRRTIKTLNLGKSRLSVVTMPTGHVMHHQFNIQQLYALPTLYLCVLYLSENKQRLVPLTA
jgi:hypothetical protein